MLRTIPPVSFATVTIPVYRSAGLGRDSYLRGPGFLVFAIVLSSDLTSENLPYPQLRA